MDEEDGAAVELDVLLQGGLLGLGGVEAEAAVQEAEGRAHAEEHEELDNWPVHVEQHGADEGRSDFVEPLGVEVGHALVSREE